VRMSLQSIRPPITVKIITHLSARDGNALTARLDRVRVISHNFGYGVGDDMDSLLARFVKD
jgi:hypothetical protein